MRFAERARVLHLYAEALAGRPVPLSSTAERPDSRGPGVSSARQLPSSAAAGFAAELPSSDGSSIFLPETVTRFDTYRENLSFYKLALVHQLGFYQWGTFSWSGGGRSSLREERPLGPLARLFRSFPRARLAREIFTLLEQGRIDARLGREYRGLRADLEHLTDWSLAERPPRRELPRLGERLEELLRSTLRGNLGLGGGAAAAAKGPGLDARIERSVAAVLAPGAGVAVSVEALKQIYPRLLAGIRDREVEIDVLLEPVPYRGTIDLEAVEARLLLLGLAQQLVGETEGAPAPLTSGEILPLILESDGLALLSLQQDQLFALSGLLQADPGGEARGELPAVSGPGEEEGRADEPLDPAERERAEQRLVGLARELGLLDRTSPPRDEAFFYDEWDHLEEDYRRGWCRLTETELGDGDRGFVDDTRRAYAELLVQVRRQFERLRPELFKRIRRLVDGEELDLDAAVESVCDRRAGRAPDEAIYSRRQRQARDVAAVFLLDMSASTDSEAPAAAPGPQPATAPAAAAAIEPDFVSILEEDPLWGPAAGNRAPRPASRRVIDVEKEALVLMAEALERLGDAYAIYGFSGYGRLEVDFFVAKEFGERYDGRVQGRIAAMEPKRSTRMGPAIRHSLRKLRRQDARIKALLILSDGYPQDHDYGDDRTSRDYGLQDTMMALREARLDGVHPFCITVDPAGHDYLRELFPDRQYLVIADIAALPRELPKVYRGLTTLTPGWM